GRRPEIVRDTETLGARAIHGDDLGLDVDLLRLEVERLGVRDELRDARADLEDDERVGLLLGDDAAARRALAALIALTALLRRRRGAGFTRGATTHHLHGRAAAFARQQRLDRGDELFGLGVVERDDLLGEGLGGRLRLERLI